MRTLGLLFAMAFFTPRGAVQGDTVLAANAVLLQFIMLTSYALVGGNAADRGMGLTAGRGLHWRHDDPRDAQQYLCRAGRLSARLVAAAGHSASGAGKPRLWLAVLLFAAVRSVVLGGYYRHYRRTR